MTARQQTLDLGKDAEGKSLAASPCSEYYVTVTLRIPHRLLGRITKKSIQSKDVEIVAADWDRVREIYSPHAQGEARADSASPPQDQTL